MEEPTRTVSKNCPSCGHVMTVNYYEGEKSYYTTEDCQTCGYAKNYGANKKEST